MAGQRMDGVSPATDDLATCLLGAALDSLAAGDDVNVLLAVGDSHGESITYELTNDDVEALLEGARMQINKLVAHGGDAEAGLSMPVRYALAYEGAVNVEGNSFADAILLEFGEVDYRAYSAYCLYRGKGTGEGLAWTEPAPAGEVEPLL